MSRSQAAVTDALESGLRLVRLLALVFLVVFLGSGTTRVQPGEVALVLRAGRLHRGAGGEAVHRPGILVGLPAPLDQVIRVPVQREGEARLDALGGEPGSRATTGSLDPLATGYVLTGDRSILQLQARLRYAVADPVAFALDHEDPAVLLEALGTAALTRVLGSWAVDDALRLQRTRAGDAPGPATESLGLQLRLELQRRLDAIGSGLRVTAVELEQVLPPEEVLTEFKAVQSARIERATLRRKAAGEAARIVPEAEARRGRLVREAEAARARQVSEARSRVTAFRGLLAEYRRAPELVRLRHRSERLEAALRAAHQVVLVPPGVPPGSLRLRLPPPPGAAPPAPADAGGGGAR